ncbi:toll-like receptor 6, partial [Gigantopelta aegis]|uniref:toll-like receptor 6 n=1 Tax=Gigantopelta aegis TaxID=1735272 RepID=UPI001B88957A
FLYTVRSSRSPRQSEEAVEYEFDAFIAYDNKDLHWILHHAIPQLENKEHLKLCIHQRDFQLGGLIADDIVHCVNSSRKFIILLSKHFADSQWCRFELAVIQRQLRSQCKDILIVVKLGSIDHHHMSPCLFQLLTVPDYIEWSDEPRARRPLWERLVHFIRREPSLLLSFDRSAAYDRSGFVDDDSRSGQTGLRSGTYNRLPSEPCPSRAGRAAHNVTV